MARISNGSGAGGTTEEESSEPERRDSSSRFGEELGGDPAGGDSTSQSQPPGGGPETVEDPEPAPDPSSDDTDGDGGGTDFNPEQPGDQAPPGTGAGHGIDGPGTPPDQTSGPTSTETDPNPPPSEGGPIPEGAPESVPSREPTDADPTATTNVTRGELLATDEVQSYLAETGLRPDEIEFRAEEGVGSGGSIEFSIRPTEEGVERLEGEARSDAAEQIEADLEGRSLTPQGERLVPDFLRAAVAPDVDITGEDIQLTEGGFTLTPEATARVDEAFAGATGPPAGRVSGAASASSALGSQQADARQAGAARLSGFAAATSAQANRSPTPALDAAVEDAKNLLGVNVAQFGEREVIPGPRAGRRERVGTTRVSLGTLTDGPLTLPAFGDRPVTPGPGSAPRDRVGVNTILQGPLVQDFGRQRDFGDFFGSFEGPRGDRPIVPGPGSAPRSRDETQTVDETFDDLVEASAEFGELGQLPVGDREIVPGPRAGARERVPAEQAPEDQQLGAEVLSVAASTPGLLLAGGGQLLVDVGDFGAETVGALSPELGPREQVPGPRAGSRPVVAGPDFDRVGELFGGAGQTGVNVAAGGASQFVAAPVETGVLAGTTLVASAGVFGAAAAVGPRTSLATRALIQPGEEALGASLFYGARGAGRAVGSPSAGRRAARTIAPNREPIFFSEEYAIRQISRANRRIRARAAEVDLPSPGRANVEGLFGELSTEARIQSGFEARDPRLLVEGPFMAEDPATVGRGGPSIQVLDTEADTRTGLEGPDTEADPDAGEPGDGGAVGSGGGFDVALKQRTGTGQAELLRMRVPREIETEFAELEGRTRDAEAFDRRRRLETSFGSEALLAETPSMVAEARSVGLDAGELLGPADAGELDTPGEADLELRTPAELEFEREAEPPRGREVLVEREAEREAETELFAEAESEAEFEAEAFDLRGVDDREAGGLLGLVDRTLHFEFYDPLEPIGTEPSAESNPLLASVGRDRSALGPSEPARREPEPLLDIWGGGPGPGVGERSPADSLLERAARFGLGTEPAGGSTADTRGGPTPGDILALAGVGSTETGPSEPARSDPLGFFGGVGANPSPSSAGPSIPDAPWMATDAGASDIDLPGLNNEQSNDDGRDALERIGGGFL